MFYKNFENNIKNIIIKIIQVDSIILLYDSDMFLLA